MKQEVSIQLGLSGQEFVAALGREDTRINKQPAGLNFYDLDWPTTFPGKVVVQHGVNGFVLDAALSVMGTEDVDYPKEGVSVLDINFGVTASDLIPHNEARLQVMALLNRLQEAGWKQHYYFGEARIKGRSSFRMKTNSLDVRYTPTLEEWMALENSASWQLQANGVYMELSMHRDSDRMDPQRPGAYLMSMTLKTDEVAYRSLFTEEERPRWKELWVQGLKSEHEARVKAEAQARAKGLEIDTQYQDPEILALKKD
ncbi:hypothetical protein KIK84_16170 [Curvibacter sp. CHRR-16]|uniref:hypothetical protein n=1 Tax=Curvibacter sp. CHRR-16 TaxID=2835872 RepID=UPI001BD9FB1A|nr:hypothetical protein [Curvibacter sp. CHRR-16]MBT0571852.1 hypothetical protein [Curvibacter sp. CHRR-16]